MSQHIPDLTERFPEGFGGVDMTDRFFPSRRASWEDFTEEELIGYDEIPYEVPGEEEIRYRNNRRFAVGQKYSWTDWFTGGVSHYTVTEINEDEVVMSEYRMEIDGEYEFIQHYNVHRTVDGDEYIVICVYKDEEGRMYAE